MNSGFIEDPLFRQLYQFSRDGDVGFASLVGGQQ
jgi:hypothetical protein